MDRTDLIDALGALKASLVLEGVEHLYLFGSFARREAADNSDVDLAFDISPDFEAKFSLIDQARVQRELTAALGRNVDLLERQYLRPRVAATAASEMIQIF